MTPGFGRPYKRGMLTRQVCLALCGSLFVSAPVYSASVTLLESFEGFDNDTIEDSVLPWAADRTQYRVFEESERSDFGQATDGTKALEVRFTQPINGAWGQDFHVALSPEASALFTAAWNQDAPHRYWLLYDMTFLSSGVGWANNPFWFGSPANASYGDQVEFNGTFDEPITAAIEFDSVRNGSELVPLEDGRVALGFGFNSDAQENSRVWIDNIRLLDTYEPGRGPTEILIDGFEDEFDSLLVPSGFEVFPYDQMGPDDLNVTEGEMSSRVEIFDGAWTTTSVLDLNLSDDLLDVLADFLPEERLNYILSFDYRIVPDPNTTINWFLLIPQASGLRLSPGWSNSAARTFSINLGLVDWETPPQLNLITQGGFDGFVDLYIDQVRLINTEGEAADTLPTPPLTPVPPVPPVPPVAIPAPTITGIERNAEGVQLQFESTADASYAVWSSPDVARPLSEWTVAAAAVAATGGATTWTDAAAGEGDRFYLIRVNE